MNSSPTAMAGSASPLYIFFSSAKSEVVRFIEYMLEDKADNWQAFEKAIRIVVNVSVSYRSNYEDIWFINSNKM